MYCRICGREIPDEAAYCPGCGARAALPEEPYEDDVVDDVMYDADFSDDDPEDIPQEYPLSMRERKAREAEEAEARGKRRKVAAASMVAVVAVVILGAVVLSGALDGPEPEVTVGNTTVTGSLAGMGDVTVSDGSISYTGDGSARWGCKDLYGPYLTEKPLGRYEVRGYDTVRGSTLALAPGGYDVVLYVDGDEKGAATVMVQGTVSKTFSWKSVVAGEAADVSVTFSYAVSDLEGYWDYGGVRHMSDYESNTRFVVVDDAIAGLEKALKRAYSSAYGAPAIGQGYADFILGFVQCCIDYPDMVAEIDGRYVADPDEGSGDTYLYGEREYWAYPLQTLALSMGDCEDTTFLHCALLSAAGYRSAVMLLPDHAMSGVFLESFQERLYKAQVLSSKRLKADGTVAYICETTYDLCIAAGYVGKDTAEEIRDINELFVVEAAA